MTEKSKMRFCKRSFISELFCFHIPTYSNFFCNFNTIKETNFIGKAGCFFVRISNENSSDFGSDSTSTYVCNLSSTYFDLSKMISRYLKNKRHQNCSWTSIGIPDRNSAGCLLNEGKTERTIWFRSVNPIPTMGGRLCRPFTSGTPNVFHLPASLYSIIVTI